MIKSDEFWAALYAIAEGYKVSGHHDRIIVVENPRFKEDDGSNPNLVIDVEDFYQIWKQLEYAKE